MCVVMGPIWASRWRAPGRALATASFCFRGRKVAHCVRKAICDISVWVAGGDGAGQAGAGARLGFGAVRVRCGAGVRCGRNSVGGWDLGARREITKIGRGLGRSSEDVAEM